VGTGQPTSVSAHFGFITSIAFSPGGRYLASTSEDQTTCIWDTETLRRTAVLKGHNEIVTSAAFLPDERKVATGGADGAVKTWNSAPRIASDRALPLSRLMAAEMIGEYRGSISPDRGMMAMITKDGAGSLVDLRAIKVAKEFAVPFTDITKVAINTGGTVLACARRTGVLSLSDMQTLAPLANFPLTSTQVVGALTFSHNGQWLAGRGANGAFQLWNVAASRELPEWRERIRGAKGLCFSPDDRMLACGHLDGSISLWSVETGVRVAELRGHAKSILQIAFSNDGRLIGSTGHDGSARVWDIQTQTQLASFTGSRENFFRVSFSPDGTRLLVNDWEDTVIFDIAAQRQLVRIKSYTPFFIDEDTLLGLSSDELWVYRPPKLVDIDAPK
jgi:WD40 repeat protein